MIRHLVSYIWVVIIKRHVEYHVSCVCYDQLYLVLIWSHWSCYIVYEVQILWVSKLSLGGIKHCGIVKLNIDSVVAGYIKESCCDEWVKVWYSDGNYKLLVKVILVKGLACRGPTRNNNDVQLEIDIVSFSVGVLWGEHLDRVVILAECCEWWQCPLH